MKTALITGASRGIGRAIALRLSEEYNIVLNYNNSKDDALLLERQIGASCYAVQADIADREQVHQLFEQANARFGSVDLLINNAGIASQQLFDACTEETLQAQLDVNYKGAFYCAQAAAPGMIHQKSGKIINIASIWGVVGASCEVAYSASKAALIGMTKALAKELAPSGIRVNCIAPGVIQTDMSACHSEETLQALRDETPLGRLGRPEDIAEAVAFFASPGADFITGQVLTIDGGLTL